MRGTTIFFHCLRQVLGNAAMAMRISWWLVVVVVAAYAGMQALSADWVAYIQESVNSGIFEGSPPRGNTGAVLAYALVISIIIIWSFIVVAIAWHRYILLEEMPTGVVPYRKDYRVGGYLGNTLLIVLLSMLASMAIGVVVGMLVIPLAGGAGSGALFTITTIVGLIIGVIISVIYLRLSLVLPAVALDKRLGLGEAWSISRGFSMDIAVLAVWTVALQFGFNLLIGTLARMAVPDIGIILISLAYQWFHLILTISILSTLYGHIVEKRDVF